MARRTKQQAQQTRTRIVDAALAAFAEHGVRATTLEDVAVRAGVTRGAVYWHFANRPALVLEVISDLRWPLEIGADFDAYRRHPRPLALLQQNLYREIERCMNSPGQRQRVLLALDPHVRAELGAAALARIDREVAACEQGLERVAALAHQLGQLRAGLTPATVAHGLCAVGRAALSERPREMAPASRWVAPPYLELFLCGVCAAGQCHGLEVR
jgi:TetR/AcrR family acrAB operon transcriptional repressor